MSWIQILKDAGAHKTGERIDKEDGAAKTLVELGYAKACDAPAADTPEDAGKKLLGDTITAAVLKGMDSLRKELEPVTKRFRDVNGEGYELGSAKSLKLPATAKRFSSVKHFTGPDKETKAYFFGAFCLALKGKGWAMKRLRENNIPLQPYDDGDDSSDTQSLGADGVMTKAAAESLNSDSAVLVPDIFGQDIIDLREQYGIFRQHAKIVPMSSDTRTDPRRRDGVATYFVGEGAGGTQADKTWDNVRLTARKLMALTKYSSEVSEDAVINIGDDLASEFAYAFALKEDQCGFLGDGTSTYGGMRGVNFRLKNVDGTIANIVGLTVASGTGYATNYNSIVLSDFNKVVGTLPEYAEQRDPACAWYMSKFFWGAVAQKLATAAGGNRVMDIENGARQKSFLGYPVIISQVMPKTSATSQVCCLLGSLNLSTNFGTRREIGISVSNAALNAFEQDQLAMRGTERFDINVHDVGDSSATGLAASTQAGAVAGPIVGLITASS